VSRIFQFLQGKSFDSEATHLIGLAYEKACQRLHDASQPELIQEIIAARIIKAAGNGERDPDKLFERALQGLGVGDYLRRQA
jgi:hypothetical protein